MQQLSNNWINISLLTWLYNKALITLCVLVKHFFGTEAAVRGQDFPSVEFV